MIKVAIGGQLVKQDIKTLIESEGGVFITSEIFTDMEASMKVNSGEFDFYLGSCQSGAGGALAMAYAILGHGKCVTIANGLKKPDSQTVKDEINAGKKAFGFTNDRYEMAVLAFIEAIKS